MPLALYFDPSFQRSLKKLDSGQQKTVASILEALQAYFLSNCNLSVACNIAPRFFYKKLQGSYYEAGVESKIRIVIEREKSKCFAILVGNHDQIKRFLASH